MIANNIQKKEKMGWVDRGCTDLAQNRDRSPAVVNAVMKFGCPEIRGIF
jgi:hypothetical protein